MRELAIILCCSVLFLTACSDSSVTEREPKIEKDEILSTIRPEKPVKIQLKRNAKGEYSWDIRGVDVDKIIEADGKLKSSIKQTGKEAAR